MQSYAHLISQLLRVYRTVRSHGELVAALDIPLNDVTQLPAYAAMERSMPLPPGFDQRVYEFADDRGTRRGVIDVAFHGTDLVNARAQVFFRGLFAAARARRFVRAAVAPILSAKFGPPIAVIGGDHYTYRTHGLVAVTQFVDAGPSVSTYITDEHFA